MGMKNPTKFPKPYAVPYLTLIRLDSRTMQSTPESGARAGYDGAKRRKGAKVHAAVDTLGHLGANATGHSVGASGINEMIGN